MKKVLFTLFVTGLIFITTWSRAQVTNLYHFEREFVPFTNSSAPVTAYKIIMGADQLTGIVGPTNIIIISNQTFATEYEGYAWGYDSHWAAWTSALSVHSQYIQIHSNVFYDNAGYIKGTREAYGTYGAYVWYLKNTIAFTSSASSVYVDSSGVTSPIASVLVGTIGDFCPQTVVTDVGPLLNTNYLGDGVSTDYVARADVNAYYKLVPFAYLGVNNDDSDVDGIPDFADGYNLDSGNSLDNISSNDFFTPWKLMLSGYADPTQAQIRITYNTSDPMSVSVTTNSYTPASGYFRLWRKQANQTRSGVSILSGGDFIPSGTYAATSLGFSASTRLLDVYLEPINKETNQTLLVEIDPDGTGPNGFVCVDKVSLGLLSIVLEPITTRPGNGSSFPLYNPCSIMLNSNSQFEINIEPTTISDSIITWHNITGHVSFVGINSNTGRIVTIQGDAVGEAQVEVRVEGYGGNIPKIGFNVFTQETINVFVFIISDSNNVHATTQTRIDDLIRDVNKIYQQAGMSFVQNGVATIITNAAWLSLSSANNFQDFRDMCSSAQHTGGIEMYFVDAIDGGSIRGLNLNSQSAEAGCAVSDIGDFRTVAHELGHSSGLDDIYDDDTFGTPLPDELVRITWAPKDWNNGSSPQYYSTTLDHKDLIRRLLLYGYGGTNIFKADIPSGTIYGFKNVGSIRVTTSVAVGLDAMNRRPEHW